MRRSPLFWMSLASLVLAAGLYGCETPEAFHVSGDGSLLANGTGGDGVSTGTGGGLGTGGILATGGSFGTGGFTLSTGGTIVPATGGAGGRTSTGGTAGGGKGGSTSVGSGGHATGGAVASGGTPAGGSVGTGGRGLGGSVGSGGISPGTGGSGNNGGHPATGGSGMGGSAAGGSVGTGPCGGLCSPATDFKFTSGTTYQSGNLGTTAACYEVATTLTIQGGGCSNCTVSSPARTVKINGATASNSGSWTGIPAKVNGGYCIQITAGNPDYTQFYTF